MRPLEAEISADCLTLSDARFTDACLPDRFYAVLGPPTRVIAAGTPAPAGHRNNQIHLFDELGLHLNEHHYTYLVQEVAFVLWPKESPFPPAAAFSGSLMVGGVAVAAGISEAELLESSLPFQESLRGTWSADSSGFSVSFGTRGRKKQGGGRGKTRYVTAVSVCLKHDPWDARFRPT